MKRLKLKSKHFRTPFGGRVLFRAKGKRKAYKMVLRAYTGKPVEVEGFEYPVIIDLRGHTFDKDVTAVLADHKTTNRIGHTLEQISLRAGQAGFLNGNPVKGPLIAAVGLRSSNMEVAKGFEKDARAGFPFQVSVGTTIIKGYVLEEGEEAEINGRKWEGPLIVAKVSRTRELSVTVLGADNDTSAMVVAAKAQLREKAMTFKAWVKNLGLSLAKQSALTRKKLRARYDEEEKRRIKAKRRELVLAGGGGEEDNDGGDDDPDDDSGGGQGQGRRKMPKVKVKAKRDINDADTGDEENEIVERAEKRIQARASVVEAIGEIYEEFKGKFADDYVFDVGTEDDPKELSYKEFKAHAIRKKWTPEHYELQLRRADLPELDHKPAIQIINKELDAKALTCALLRANEVPDLEKNKKSGRDYGLETMFDEKVMNASLEKKYQLGNSINRLYALQIAAAGGYAGHLDSNDLHAAAHAAWVKLHGPDGRTVRASGFSTLNIVNILEDAMHKAAYAAFEAVEAVWRSITAIRPLNDFKIHNMYRLDWQGHFRRVAADGELKHLSMVDTKKTIQAETFGAMITVDRKTRVNDDLGMVVSQARSLGMLGAMRVEEAIFVLWLSNPGSFYSAPNGNLLTGGGSVLGIDALTLAKQRFRDQVINGRPISVSPSILLVGTQHEILADRLYRQSRTEVTTTANVQQFADNPHVGNYRPVSTGWLNNTSITDQDGLGLTGQTATQWALFAPPSAPQGSALVIGFLNGRQSPFFDEAETQFNIPDGIQMRGYFDFGVAMHIHQMSLKSAGA